MNSKKFIMRTLLQKLNACATALLLVGLFSVNAFSQTCDVVAVNCFIDGASDAPIVLILDDATCQATMTDPFVGLSGSGDCADGNEYISLVEYVFYQYNGTPTTTTVTGNTTDTPGAVLFSNPGTYVLLYHLFADDGDAVADACVMQEVEVKIANSIACNDQVQVTMDGECMATITLDMVLEGESGNCYLDFYLMTIDGYGEDQTEITIDTPGDYTVSIITPTGEQCWGTILVEDKISALLTNCQDFEIFCNQTYEPGDPIMDHHVVPQAVDTDGMPVYVDVDINGVETPINCTTVPATATVPSVVDPTVDSLAIGSDTIFFDLTTVGTNQTVQSFEEIAFSLEAANINTINAYLVSPSGTTIQVLDLISGNTCTESDLDIILSDDAFRTHNVLTSSSNCGLGSKHSYCGDYQPLNPLSGMNGEVVNGEWLLIIENHDENNDACITGGSISLIGDSGMVPYPFDGVVTETGDQEYTIALPNNNCGPYTASYVDETTVECTPGIGKMVERTWTVVSQSSGVESLCKQNIEIKIWDLADLVTPPDYDGTDYAPFFCSQFFDSNGSLIASMLTDEGAPLPSVTGGISAPFGNLDLCENYGSTYADQILPIF